MKKQRQIYLPMDRVDLEKQGLDQLDIIIVSGDAYVDHPSFAAAILGRYLEHRGYSVGIIAQPNWKDVEDIKKLGQPRLFFAVSAGNMDSMLSHYTADKKRRSTDAYSPGGAVGRRPDRATIVYSNLIQQAYPGVPVIIGGIEASMRRLAHYDYWSDTVRRSILVDSKADLLVFGMGEQALTEIAERLSQGKGIEQVTDIAGTAYLSRHLPAKAIEIPDFEQVKEDKKAFNESFKLIYRENNPYTGKKVAQRHDQRWVVQNPPRIPLTTEEMDEIYDQPFQRRWHPVYHDKGGIPALKPVQFSVVSHRGCFGGCSFCTLALHQGKYIQSRSIESLVQEVEKISRHPDFKGTISDVGGPTANMYGLSGIDAAKCKTCLRSSCLSPSRCRNLDADHKQSIQVLQALRKIPKVKHVFISSGIRHDLLLADPDHKYLHEICENHISGQLKIAPEHVSSNVTKLMGKPSRDTWLKFMKEYKLINEQLGRKQYLSAYFIAGHPGCGVREMIELAEFVRDNLDYHPEQVQNFTPTPMSLSTCMFHTGINPLTGEKVYVPRQEIARRMQRAVLQYRDPANRELVIEALKKCHRMDLVGNHKKVLIYEEKKPVNKVEKSNESPKTGQWNGAKSRNTSAKKPGAKTSDNRKRKK
ncbi:MAG: YgiQ family radical SAM protein [Acidobacteriota bacterium]